MKDNCENYHMGKWEATAKFQVLKRITRKDLVLMYAREPNAKRIENLKSLKKESEEIIKTSKYLTEHEEFMILPLIEEVIEYILKNPNTKFKNVTTLKSNNLTFGIALITENNKLIGHYYDD